MKNTLTLLLGILVAILILSSCSSSSRSGRRAQQIKESTGLVDIYIIEKNKLEEIAIPAVYYRHSNVNDTLILFRTLKTLKYDVWGLNGKKPEDFVDKDGYVDFFKGIIKEKRG